MSIIDTEQSAEELIVWLQKIENPATLNHDEVKKCMIILKSYECWTPYFELLNNLIARKDDHQFEYYLAYIQTKNIFMEDVSSSIEMSGKMIRDLELNFKLFSNDVLPQIIKPEDHLTRASFLSKLKNEFKTKEDKINCLEMLAMLYDKKLFFEEELLEVYKELRDFDPKNTKALNFFKTNYIQSNDWEQVAKILQDLLTYVNDKEKYRIAQELAGVYVYHLNKSSEAVEILELYRSQNPLDSSEILYDAYDYLGNIEGCLSVLDNYDKMISDEYTKAIIYYRKGQLQFRKGWIKNAKANFIQSSKYNSDFLEPLEELIHISVQYQEWSELQNHLINLSGKLKQNKLKQKIADLLFRVKRYVKNEGSE